VATVVETMVTRRLVGARMPSWGEGVARGKRDTEPMPPRRPRAIRGMVPKSERYLFDDRGGVD
jgi:hypothetical protein